MKTGKSIYFFILGGIFIFSGCSKDKGPKIKAAFTISPDSVEVYDTVEFNNQSEGAKFYQWDFGDNNTSIDENPTHIYKKKGTYSVSLTAIGDNGSDKTSTDIKVAPYKGNTITEGMGIPEVNVGDTWADVKTTLPPTDTIYYSYYYADYNLWNNLVYYPNDGIVAGFASKDSVISKSDQVYLVIIVKPYVGTTTKGITLGSTLTHVEDAYGTPENTDNSDPKYTGYSYASVGIDFYTHNQQDSNAVAEIDVYSAQGAGRISIPDHTQINNIRKNLRIGVADDNRE